MNYKFEIINKQIPYDGFFQMEAYRLRHELFAGGWSAEVRRECLERGHAVAVLPYDVQRDQVVLIEQFRIGALAAATRPWMLEIVAGIIGPGEAKEDVARRETMEEIGCGLSEIMPICEFMPSPGGSSETITLYCGLVDASQAGELQGLDEEHEDIRVHVVSRDDALDLLHKGRIVAATPIIALQWLEANHKTLLAR